MKLQVRERQAQACNAAVGIHLKRRFKVADGALRVLHIIADVTAVHQRLKHLGVFIQRPREIVNGLLQQLVLLVNMAGQKREIGLFREDRLIPAYQSQDLIVAAQVVVVIAKVNGGIAIMRQLLYCLLAQARRFRVLSFEEEIALGLTHDARIVLHRAGGAFYPLSRQIHFAGLDGRI